MPTLGTIVRATSGLYRDLRSSQQYTREELLQALPGEQIDQPAGLEKLGSGRYSISLQGEAEPSYEVLSRRRGRR